MNARALLWRSCVDHRAFKSNRTCLLLYIFHVGHYQAIFAAFSTVFYQVPHSQASGTPETHAHVPVSKQGLALRHTHDTYATLPGRFTTSLLPSIIALRWLFHSAKIWHL
ncbi:hypothetical protein EV424DRAFT_1407218 [Suillus variegatus]|nr:hypothetical protein EV424DRAFT_1407218 [Suillus variegatus]